MERALSTKQSFLILLLAKRDVCRHDGMVGRLLGRPTTVTVIEERGRSLTGLVDSERAALLAIANGPLIALFFFFRGGTKLPPKQDRSTASSTQRKAPRRQGPESPNGGC